MKSLASTKRRQSLRLVGGTIIALASVLSTGANACHRFSRWYYPYAQQCKVSSAQRAEDTSWYVELILPDQEELDHIEAIQQYKETLNMLFTAKQTQRDQINAPIWEYQPQGVNK